MEHVNISGTVRTEMGKTAAKNLRLSDEILCSIYGGKENINFTTKLIDVKNLVYTPSFKLAKITVGKETITAILKDIQFHPVTEKILHIDFLRLIDGHPIKVEVPIVCTGNSSGVKEGGKFIQKLRTAKIKCLPKDLVSEMTLDISSLGLGATTRVRDLVQQPGIEVLNNGSVPVASIDIPRALRSAK
jgi:large subunit ribosomal protein L25